jgi:hypothetical protein
MFEVFYQSPTDEAREQRIAGTVARHGGKLDFREAPEVDGSHNICLTYEFANLELAVAAAIELQLSGEYVEGPYQYT